MTGLPLRRIDKRLVNQKKEVVFRLKRERATCNLHEIQTFFSEIGVIHIDGRFCFPKNGKQFLEAIYDHYFLKRNGLAYPNENRKNHL
jgi:hypothetical protein